FSPLFHAPLRNSIWQECWFFSIVNPIRDSQRPATKLLFLRWHAILLAHRIKFIFLIRHWKMDYPQHFPKSLQISLDSTPNPHPMTTYPRSKRTFGTTTSKSLSVSTSLQDEKLLN